jgi:hypothetical protein
MSVKIINGIGFGSKAVFMDMSEGSELVSSASKDITPSIPDEKEFKKIPWSSWGKDNKLPIRMAEDIESCGILNSIIDGKARFAICNGILPAVVRYDEKGQMQIEKIVIDSEIDDFLEENNHFFHTMGWMRDLCGFGNGVGRIMLNKSRDKIATFQRDDVVEMRYQKMDEKTGKINQIYLSASWDKVGTNPNDNRIIPIQLLNPSGPLKHLRELVDSTKINEFAMTFRYPSWNRKYYSQPLWYAAKKWVDIAKGVPEMKAQMFANNVRPKFMVVISERYWERVIVEENKAFHDYTEKEIAEKKQRIYDEIDQYLAGNENAYKTVFCDGYIDPNGTMHPEIDIKPIQDTTQSGELLPDSAAANSEIAFAMLFNPAIIGANMPSGPYTNSEGGSNVREASLIQVIIHEMERQHIRSFFNVIKKFNGWDKRFGSDGESKLEFLIPATIPTTLDTGSNVKPMMTGANPTTKNQPNGTDQNNS